MSRSALFGRLQRLVSVAVHARRHGITDPEAARAAWEQADRGPTLDRRQVLGLAGAAAATVALTPATGCKKAGGEKVVVVGGGMAGLHCAYRLWEAGVDVTVYDSSDRVGGRMWTGRDMYADGQVFEIGGELIDSNHATLWALADEFGIQLDDRQAGTPAGMLPELWLVNGAAVSSDTLLEQMIACSDAFVTAFDGAETDDDAFETLDNTSLRDWLDTYVPVSTYPELHAVLDVAYRGEFGLENDQQSCLNLIYLIDIDPDDEFLIFGDSDERYHTHLGNDTFTEALAGPLRDEGRIVVSSALTAAADDGAGYRLTFTGADGSATEVQCDHVVFALPFTRLRQVDLSGLTLSDDKRTIIDELAYGTNAKVMGGFSRRVWLTDHNQSGSMTTDMGVQQTWDTSVGQDGDSGILTNFLGGDQGVASGNGTAEEWFEGILPDLETAWPGATAAYTAGSAQRMHWPSYAHSLGSYTCYTPGQWAFWSMEGVREGNLHFCGEHCSLDFQGWMEGAAETGALVAAEVLDDLGLTRSEGLSAIVGAKLALPQACYHGDRLPRMNPITRRRQVRRLWRQQLGRG